MSEEKPESRWNPRLKKDIDKILDPGSDLNSRTRGEIEDIIERTKFGEPYHPKGTPSKKIREWTTERLTPRLDKLPVLGEKIARAAFRYQIEKTKKIVGSFFLLWQEGDKPAILYRGKRPIGKMPREQAEKLLFEELVSFGVKKDYSFPSHSGHPSDSDSSTIQEDVFPGYEYISYSSRDFLSYEPVDLTLKKKLFFTRYESKDRDNYNQHYYWTVDRPVSDSRVE